jgi:hypothetical protein
LLIIYFSCLKLSKKTFPLNGNITNQQETKTAPKK